MNKQKDLSMDAVITLKERLAYTLGGGGVNINMAILGLLLTYYTMVLGISAGTATMVIGVSKILDGISDLVMGYIVDHTHSKQGKARPWLLRMAIPTAVATVASFAVPGGWNTTAKVIYMFLTYNLSNTIGYTALAVSFNSLNGYMTTNQKSRGVNGGFVMIMNTLTNIIVNTLYLQLSRFFGGGDVYSARGWTITMIVFSIAFCVMIFICYAGTTERACNVEQVEEKKANINIKKSIKALVTNKYWWICIVNMLVVFTLAALVTTTIVYFAQFILGSVDLQPVLTLAMSLPMIPASIVAIAVVGKLV